MENFKDIEGYNGLYKISNLGNIFSYISNKILTPRIDSLGYKQITLYNKGFKKVFRIHRIVGNHFIKNYGYNCLNHKNGIKTDNRVENLERCSNSHNTKEAYRLGLKINCNIGKFGKLHHNSKKIVQYTLNGYILEIWDSFADIQRNTLLNKGNINQCCKGKRNKCGGYIWKYY
ncbi:hypothetical protein EOM39_03340 [Candidatus Gracilibacteria bacterium]|nr:hypothetical protein [Candidatus Gracilibacteria bacterium]